ncbi:hypothetical protein P7C73_g943, partial [Tremellales sp. Uapishka_1]
MSGEVPLKMPRTLTCLPPELMKSVILHITKPSTHRTLLHTCHLTRAAYDEKTYQKLCLIVGFGRAKKYEGWSWAKLYHKVTGHAATCKVPLCSFYAVPPPKLGRVLLNTESVTAHTLSNDIIIHPFLKKLGYESYNKFVDELLQQQPAPLEDGQDAVDWETDQSIVPKEDIASTCVFGGHILLENAFCCEPPVTNAIMTCREPEEEPDVSVEDGYLDNSSGVTIRDFMEIIAEWWAACLI